MVIESDAPTNKYPPIASTAAVIAALPRVIHRLSASSRRAIRIFKTPQRFTLLGGASKCSLIARRRPARSVQSMVCSARNPIGRSRSLRLSASQRNQLAALAAGRPLREPSAIWQTKQSKGQSRPCNLRAPEPAFIKLLSGREFSIPPDRITLFREEGCQSSCFGPIDRGVANENVCHCCPRQPMKQRCKLSNSRNCVDPPDTWIFAHFN